MSSHRIMRKVHVPVVLAGTAAVLSVFALQVARGGVQAPPALHLGLWLALVLLAVASPIPLPRRRAEASLVPVVEFAAIVALDPAVACGLRSLCSLISVAGDKKWSAASILSAGSAVLPVGCAALAFHAVGSWPGISVEFWVRFVLQIGVAALVYLPLRHGLAAWQDALRCPLWVRSSLRDSADRFIWDVLLLPCGMLLAIVHLRSGIVGTSLFFIPLILARHLGRIWGHAKTAQLEAVRTLMAAVDAADPFTRGHSYRVSTMCVAVGRRMGLRQEELEVLEYAALLHDIGRTAIQREIIFKPGELDDGERDILRTHPRLGRDTLERIGFLPRAAEIVYSHHEQPDGQGYPEGLTREAIPMGSRIVMVVAAFDAMTSDRPYRRGMSTAAAFEELLARGGTQFFSDVVQALIEAFADGELFEHFTADVMEEHARGEGSSRAIAEFVARRRVLAETPRAQLLAPESTPETEVPVLDLESDVESAVERVLPLAQPGWSLVVCARSDCGCVRETNEDAWGIFPGEDSGACLLAVADGMGGQAGGEVASRLAIETVRGAFFGEAVGQEAGAALREAVLLANDVIRARGSEDALLLGMGTTCVAASVSGSELTVAHVGDSRAYLIDGRRIQQLTRDHNLAEEFATVGRKGPEGSQHVLTRTLGGGVNVEVDLTPAIQLQDDNVVVLCSDGLSHLVSPDEILEAALEGGPAVACRRLVDKALRRGAPDNVTVVVARVARRDDSGRNERRS